MMTLSFTPVHSLTSTPAGSPGAFLKCSQCGTITDQWWYANHLTGICRCLICEAGGTSKAVSPIGFITCSEPRTSNSIRFGRYTWEHAAFDRWEKETKLQRIKETNYAFDLCPGCTRSCDPCRMSRQFMFGLPKHGYKVSLYPSGELTGAMYSRNSQSRPPRTLGSAQSTHVTHAAKQKIRRAVENSPYKLTVFMTLTFSPAIVRKTLGAAGLNDYATFRNPTVSHSYAKKELVRFLNTLSKRQRRTVDQRGCGELLQYIWTAELQKNGNIHFHILLNTRFPIKWLSSIWKQSNNSVDVRSLNDVEHAARYIVKYISKDEKSVIDGRRYYITDGLRSAMQPAIMDYEGLEMKKEVQQIIEAMKEDIENEGGHVLDFGFHLPKPQRSRPYNQVKTDRNGKKTKTKKFTRSTSSRIQVPILDMLDDHYTANQVPF